MSEKKITAIVPAVQDDIADLKTFRALPTQHIETLDPFLFLNHHGPQVYPQNNRGLPFGPHPHRGFETVTFILQGELTHKDSAGHESTILAGGVQWMTAGRGLVHAEVSSEKFMKSGGPLEILQLWVNLPARLKMTEPKYVGLQENQIKKHRTADDQVEVSLVSGEWEQQRGPIQPLVNITTLVATLKTKAEWNLNIPATHEVFFYVVKGQVKVNEKSAKAFHLVKFDQSGSTIQVEALAESIILLCHAEPFREPIVSHGPFVMNTREEIHQAIKDYQAGKF